MDLITYLIKSVDPFVVGELVESDSGWRAKVWTSMRETTLSEAQEGAWNCC